jgi:hypothetical protein
MGEERVGIEIFSEATHGPSYRTPKIQVFFPSEHEYDENGNLFVARDMDLYQMFTGDLPGTTSTTIAPGVTPSWFSDDVHAHLDSLTPQQQHRQVTFECSPNSVTHSVLGFAISCGCDTSVIKRMLSIAPSAASKLGVAANPEFGEMYFYPVHHSTAADIDIVKMLIKKCPEALTHVLVPQLVEQGITYRLDMLLVGQHREGLISKATLELVQKATAAYECGNLNELNKLCRTREEMEDIAHTRVTVLMCMENIEKTQSGRVFEPTCACCGVTGELQRCARCKDVHFCGRECQKQAWPTHKKRCAKRVAPVLVPQIAYDTWATASDVWSVILEFMV